MGFWRLVQAGLWRRPPRTIFAVTSLAVGFLLFGLMQSVNAAFGAAVARSHANRLMVSGRFGNALPLTYSNRIARLPGVQQLTGLGLLPSYYRNPTDPLMVLATSPARFFSVFDEYKISTAALNRLIQTRTGIIVLDTVAKRFGWKVGDQVSIISPIAARGAGHTWTFDVVGIVTCPSNPTHPPFAVINYRYFDTARALGQSTVAWFYVEVADLRRTVSVGRAIDRLFANSSAPTFSEQESEFAAQGVSEIGNVRWLTDSTIVAVLFAMISLTANVVFESVRERTSEWAVLKALGYSNFRLLMLIELETLLLCLSGAIIGLAAAAIAFRFVGRAMGKLSGFLETSSALPPEIILAAVGSAVALALVAAAIPIWVSNRVSIVKALSVRT